MSDDREIAKDCLLDWLADLTDGEVDALLRGATYSVNIGRAAERVLRDRKE